MNWRPELSHMPSEIEADKQTNKHNAHSLTAHYEKCRTHNMHIHINNIISSL